MVNCVTLSVSCVTLSVSCVTLSVNCVTLSVSCVTLLVNCVTLSVSCVTLLVYSVSRVVLYPHLSPPETTTGSVQEQQSNSDVRTNNCTHSLTHSLTHLVTCLPPQTLLFIRPSPPPQEEVKDNWDDVSGDEEAESVSDLV